MQDKNNGKNLIKRTWETQRWLKLIQLVPVNKKHELLDDVL